MTLVSWRHITSASKESNSSLSLILLARIPFIFQVSIFILISCWYHKCIGSECWSHTGHMDAHLKHYIRSRSEAMKKNNNYMLICCIQPDQCDDLSKLNFWKDKHFVTMFTLFLGLSSKTSCTINILNSSKY